MNMDFGDLFEEVPVQAFAILYLIGAGLWTYTANFWIEKGMQVSLFFRILVYIMIAPVTYFVAQYWATKE